MSSQYWKSISSGSRYSSVIISDSSVVSARLEDPVSPIGPSRPDSSTTSFFDSGFRKSETVFIFCNFSHILYIIYTRLFWVCYNLNKILIIGIT